MPDEVNKPVSNQSGDVSTRDKCPDRKSKELESDETPGNRGNCEKETTSQGSE
jgi:hypothetical protein